MAALILHTIERALENKSIGKSHASPRLREATRAQKTIGEASAVIMHFSLRWVEGIYRPPPAITSDAGPPGCRASDGHRLLVSLAAVGRR
mmetsp:Transcript_47497/g.119706  ORF Transcript_47497/g.119706 Transcript_47497/m.119706 type:complete len:90 (+) Transcript_47497:94-363(+)